MTNHESIWRVSHRRTFLMTPKNLKTAFSRQSSSFYCGTMANRQIFRGARGKVMGNCEEPFSIFGNYMYAQTDKAIVVILTSHSYSYRYSSIVGHTLESNLHNQNNSNYTFISHKHQKIPLTSIHSFLSINYWNFLSQAEGHSALDLIRPM